MSIGDVVQALIGARKCNEITFEAPVVFKCQVAAAYAVLDILYGEPCGPYIYANKNSVEDMEDRVANDTLFVGTPFIEIQKTALTLQHIEDVPPRTFRLLKSIFSAILKDCGCAVFAKLDPCFEPYFEKACQSIFEETNCSCRV